VSEIIEELDGHALAVALCAAALRLDDGLMPAVLLEQLRANEVEAEGHALEHVEADATGRKYGLKVAASLLLLLPDVEAKHPLASKLLLAASLVHPSKIPFSLLVAATDSDELEARRAILALRDRSIVQFEASAGVERKGLASIHRLMQSVIRVRNEDRLQEGGLSRIIAALNDVFDDCLQVHRWPTQGEALLHVKASLRHVAVDSQPVSELLCQTGLYLYMQGRVSEAEALYEQALAIDRRLFKGDHLDLAMSLNNLAEMRVSLGRLHEAEAMLQEAFAMRRRLFKSDHPDVANSLNNLASLYQSLERANEAEPLFEEALAMRRRLFKGDHPDLANSLNNLAGVRQVLDRASEAQPLFEEALKMARRLFGDDDPYVAQQLNNLGVIHAKQGQWDLALPFVQDAVEMGGHHLPIEHPLLQQWQANLANIRKHLDDR